MSSRASALAHREALRVRRLPDALLDGRTASPDALRALEAPAASALAKRIAARQKPELYGRFGKLTAAIVEAAFEGCSADDIPRLVCYKNGQARQATAKDRGTWHGLQACWADTLWHSTLRVAGPDNPGQRSLLALQGLWRVRMHSIGNARSFGDKLRGDAQNAATQSIRIALGMNGYQTEAGVPQGQRIIATRDSTNPVRSVAGLEMSQLEIFAGDYLGERPDGNRHTFTIHGRDIRTDMFATLPNGHVRLDGPIEDFEAGGYGTVADIPAEMPGERIGCPVLLTPGLPQLFWRGVVNSMAEAELL